MTIHKRIRERREALGLSMQALADACGVKAWQTVQQWERDDGTAPKRSRLEAVAGALNVSPEWLMTGREQQGEAHVLQFSELNGLEAQLVMLYRSMQDEDKDSLSVYANNLVNKKQPDRRSSANPFPNANKRRKEDVEK